jgi:hypothetical protein
MNTSCAYPNPFADHITIRVESDEVPGVISVYDAAGSLITNLLPDHVSGGFVLYDWAAGKNIKPGFYYYKSGTGLVAGKMVKY